MNTIKRPLLDYFGGKWRIADKIISNLPAHKSYVEVFGGAASVLFKKQPSKNEIYNDINSEVYNLFVVLRNSSEELRKLLALTPYSREEYYSCREVSNNPIEQARRTIVKSWFGIGDSLDNETGFRVSLSQGGSTTKPWVSYVDHLEAYSQRLRAVILENLDYKEVIFRYDKPDTLFYVDPPYTPISRNKLNAYKYEFNMKQHEELLAILQNVKGKVVLSGYEKGYESILWPKIVIPARANGSGGRSEILWIKDNI